MDTQNSAEIPQFIMQLITQKKYIGRMNAPDGAASIKGPCGDEVEFYLQIESDVLKDIKFQTTGCFFTYACGTITSHLAFDKKILEALQISPGTIINELKCLPKDHCHCAILAVGTLHKAIADYWLKSRC